jgi:hypothetical protein
MYYSGNKLVCNGDTYVPGVHVYRFTVFLSCFYETFSRKAVFCVRNGSATPRGEGSAKQTQVMLLGGWSAEDVA